MHTSPTGLAPTSDDSHTLRWVTRALFLAASVAWPFSTVPQASAWALGPQAKGVCMAAWSVWVWLSCAGCPSRRHLRLAEAAALLLGQALALGLGVGLGAVILLRNNGGLLLFVLTASFGALSALASRRGGGDPPRLLAMALLLFGGAFVWLAWRLGPLDTMRPSMVCAMASAMALAAVQLAALGPPGGKRRTATLVEARRSRSDAHSQGCRDALRLLCGCCLLHAAKTPKPAALLDTAHKEALNKAARRLLLRHLGLALGFVAACYGAARAMCLWDGQVAAGQHSAGDAQHLGRPEANASRQAPWQGPYSGSQKAGIEAPFHDL